MERLSKWSKIYNCYQVYIDGVRHHGSIVDKLAEYEDTELTPQEIITLNDFSQSQLAKLLEENCKLKQQRQLDITELQDLSFALIDMHDDKDFWEREAKKYCAEVGEIRILAEQELCDK